MDKPAIFAALLAGEDESPALADYYEMATERRGPLRQEIAGDFAQQLAQAAADLPTDHATESQAAVITKVRRLYGAEWLIREPGISLARAIRQQSPS